MKLNWGTGIVLAFIGFISFIMFFVIKMNMNDKYDHDLVTKQYYQKELEYQEDIDKLENSKTLKTNVTWFKTDDGIIIIFPETLKATDITGNVFLYRPSNKKLDFEMPITLSTHRLLIPKKHLLDGRWNITVDWVYEGKTYLFKDKIMY